MYSKSAVDTTHTYGRKRHSPGAHRHLRYTFATCAGARSKQGKDIRDEGFEACPSKVGNTTGSHAA